jgi:hypothetical protein
MTHYKQLPFTQLQRKLPCSEKPLEIPVINQTHPIQISCLIFIKWTFIVKPLWDSSQFNDSDICWKIWCSNLGRTIQLYLLQNIQTSSSAHPASNTSFFSGSKVASADSLTTHICLERSLKISGALPPLNLSATMAHIGTT